MYWQLKDIHFAIRGLSRRPAFALVVILTLALGVGANTAIFSVVNSVLLRPLPYSESDRLMVIWGNYRALNIERLPAKAGEYDDYAKQTQVFGAVAAYSNHSFNSVTATQPERIRGAEVSTNLFSLLHTTPGQGRVFTNDDREPVVVLSHGFWQRRFAGDRDVINRTLSLDDQTYKIIGVMPPGFEFPHPSLPRSETAEVWIPLTYTSEQVASRQGPYYLNVLARLRPGATIEQARSEMSALGQRFERELRGYRGPNGEDGGWHISVTPLQEEIVGGSRRTLILLFAAVGLLLLIACANVANLVLLRAAKRRQELAIRAALGSSRWRLVQQSLIEGLLLTSAGAALGLVFASWGMGFLSAIGPTILPRAHELVVDGRVLAFTLTTSFLTGIIVGLVPLRQISTLDLQGSLTKVDRYGSQRLSRWSGVLVASEVGLALLLLTASGLLVRSLFNLQNKNPGLTPDQLFAAEVDLTAGRYQTAGQATEFYRELSARVQTLPGVAAVTFGSLQPLSGTGSSDPFAIEGRKLDPANLTSAGWQLIGPNYLGALGIPLIRGRDLTQADMAIGAPPVAIINETMATRYWPNEDPVGRRITLGLPRPDNPWVTIVGIARSVPHRALDSQPEPDWYLSHTVTAQRHGYLFVRSVLPISSLTNSIRNEIAAIDRGQPLTGVKPMTVVIGETTAPRKFNTVVVGLFSALALLLATLGIYSVVSYSVALRTQEIGIRVALGARNQAILSLVIRRGMMPALIGVGSGLIAAVGLTRLLSAFLFGVSAFDPLTYFIVILFLVGAAFLACVIPARRASRVDPLVALRNE